MDKRTAKRMACSRAAAQVAGDIQADGIDELEGLTDQDRDRLRGALAELFEELMRRAGEKPYQVWDGGDHS